MKKKKSKNLQAQSRICLMLLHFIIVLFMANTQLLHAQINKTLPDSILNAGSIDEIKFSSGKFEISSNIYIPATKAQKYPLVIWVSGSGPSYKTVQSVQAKKIINLFLQRGIAYFRIDKPGYGDSKGKVDDANLFSQLSEIVVDAVNILKKRTEIDSTRIGLFGSSQAGYIMPIAASKSKLISFIIGSSCPGENSIDQWNYLIYKQMLCEGYSKKRAMKNAEMFNILRTTSDKAKFDEALIYFEKNPMIIKSVNYDSTLINGARTWWPREIDVNDESHFNPVTLIQKLNIPVYMVYGENDTQIDSKQAYAAYRNALSKSGNKYFGVEMLKGVDHNMCSTETGCLNEINRLNKEGKYKYSQLYFDVINNWIKLLFKK